MRINLALQLWHPSQDGKHKDQNIHTDTDRHALGPAKTLGVFLFFVGLPNMDSSRRYSLKLPTKKDRTNPKDAA